MRVLGIDYGRARLGLAVSDESCVLATPLPYLRRGWSVAGDVRRLGDLAVEHEVSRIVVGLPLLMNGSEGEMAAEVRAFAERLQESTALPVNLIDERLTTAEAERVLLEGNLSRQKRKRLQDSLAAVLILQADLDRCQTEGESPPPSEEQSARTTSSPRGGDTP